MSVQQTLTGEEADKTRTKPETFRWCHDCEEFVLRSEFWKEHNEHDWEAQKSDNVSTPGDGEEDEPEEEPERIGAWYDITVAYSVEYRFKIPALSEHQAEELAKEMHWDHPPADEFHVHTDKREVKEIMSDSPDVPDDFDPYGSERLLDAIERNEEDTEE